MSFRGRILVVCYGNLCRSPMAEGLLQHRLPAFEVRSAGTNAVGDDPPTPLAQEVMRREAEIEISAQRSSPLTVAEIAAADHIFTMSDRQARIVAALDPASAARVRLLGAFSPATGDTDVSADPGGDAAGRPEIPDPIGGTYEDYAACMSRLAAAADHCADWLLAGADSEAIPGFDDL